MMDPSQHQEMMANSSLESMLVCSKAQQERKPRPQPDQALKCPRCDSTNTKFCYYNNYSLTQPRYFCKACRRYWTKGGTLRNVPVGGGCRKNKRSSSSSKRTPDHNYQLNSSTNPLTAGISPLSYDSGDHLSLAFARLQKSSGHLGFDEHEISLMGNPSSTHCDIIIGNPSINSPAVATPFLDTIRSGFLGTQNSFQNLYYGFGNGNMAGDMDNCVGGEMVLPYEHNQDMSSSSSPATTTAVSVTTMKQEFSNGARDSTADQNRTLWGFPWQLNGDGSNMGELDNPVRDSWNGLNASWHGLLNSPLM